MNMNKYVKTFGITAALAVMVPLSAFAATSPTSTTGAAATAQVQADGSTKQADGMHGRGGFGGKFISDSVLTLLNLDRETLNEKLAAGSTLAEIATEQGVASDDLKAALTSAFEERQTNDKSQFSANLDNLISTEQLATGREDRRGRDFGHNLDAAATALNMTEDELKTELQAGKTIAALAEEKGISEDTVISALETAINAEIDQAVTDGKLTADEAATKKEETTAQAQSIVNGEFTLKGDGSHHGGGMKEKDQAETDDTTAETNA
jgi:lambda repressor-like predicted transcriptional regulator